MASPPKVRPPSAAGSRKRDSAWQAWRIADGRFDPFSAIGASLMGGRWNSPGLGVIYACRTYGGAMLECLAHAGIGRAPRTQVAIPITIPGAVSVETHDGSMLPSGWDEPDLTVGRAFGNAWIRELRSAVLMVPSVVARKESNVIINPLHPDFKAILVGSAEPVVWDARLFARRPARGTGARAAGRSKRASPHRR